MYHIFEVCNNNERIHLYYSAVGTAEKTQSQDGDGVRGVLAGPPDDPNFKIYNTPQPPSIFTSVITIVITITKSPNNICIGKKIFFLPLPLILLWH
jgi:hypothetical protein